VRTGSIMAQILQKFPATSPLDTKFTKCEVL
jgi:hypothetical protein